jgi:hypothetical protein
MEGLRNNQSPEAPTDAQFGPQIDTNPFSQGSSTDISIPQARRTLDPIRAADRTAVPCQTVEAGPNQGDAAGLPPGK